MAKAKKQTLPKTGDVLVLFGTLADTTWRLFIPTLGGTILGLWGDHSFDTKPWLTISGVVIGAILSLSLIIVQLKGIKK